MQMNSYSETCCCPRCESDFGSRPLWVRHRGYTVWGEKCVGSVYSDMSCVLVITVGRNRRACFPVCAELSGSSAKWTALCVLLLSARLLVVSVVYCLYECIIPVFNPRCWGLNLMEYNIVMTSTKFYLERKNMSGWDMWRLLGFKKAYKFWGS